MDGSGGVRVTIAIERREANATGSWADHVNFCLVTGAAVRLSRCDDADERRSFLSLVLTLHVGPSPVRGASDRST